MPVKKIEGLSTVDEIEKKVAEETPKEKPPRKKWVRPAILCLLALTILVSVIDLSSSSIVKTLAGVGSVSGFVANSKQTPVPAEIFVLTKGISTSADDNGQFLLTNVPAGDTILIIAYQGIGKEFPVKIMAGETLFIGQVTVEETQIPPEIQP
ncbi:MAG: hypothetical protein FD147_386 [Chloroflexi bacterium]|nr:MAG: hypothetical protein FD147_386 [Chloroflexota bacterium]MBA4376618.1 hypothetical protein [Anaerolinea sp.]